MKISHGTDLKAITNRLVFLNTACFLLLLAIFSATVYIFIALKTTEQAQANLSQLADAVIASVDFESPATNAAGQPRSEGQQSVALPDMIATIIPDEASQSLSQLDLEWYDNDGHLLIRKGKLALSIPFDVKAHFVEQEAPHALSLTKKAIMNGRALGFTRVAMPLKEADQSLKDVAAGLFFGCLIALLCSSVLIFFLVRQTLKPITETMRRLRQFTADASHELRGPLTAILTNCRVALKYDDQMRPKDREKLVTIADASQQMEKLVSDLLILAREDNQQEVKPKRPPHELSPGIEIDLPKLLEKIVRAQLAAGEPNGPSIIISKNALAPEKIILPQSANLAAANDAEADIESILRNLIENARKYTAAEGCVTIATEKNDSGVAIKINDTGIGISADDQKHIFDRFWRADQARSHKLGGNGLGLAIAQAQAHRYGGRITVQSPLEDGHGCSFTLILPSLPDLH